MSPEIVEKAVNDYFAAICALDAAAWLDTFAADAVSHEPGGPPLRGHAELSQFFAGIAGSLQELTMLPAGIFVVGHEAACQWNAHGTGKNGAAVAFAGIDVFHINENGKIQTVHGYWNPALLMAQLQAG